MIGAVKETLNTEPRFNFTLIDLEDLSFSNITQSIEFGLPGDLPTTSTLQMTCHSAESIVFLLKLKSDNRYVLVQIDPSSRSRFTIDIKAKIGASKATLVCEEHSTILVAESESELIFAGLSIGVKANVTQRIQVTVRLPLKDYSDYRVWTTPQSMYVGLINVTSGKEEIYQLSLTGLKRVFLKAGIDRDSLSDNEFDMIIISEGKLNSNSDRAAKDLHIKANYLRHQDTAKSKGILAYIGR